MATSPPPSTDEELPLPEIDLVGWATKTHLHADRSLPGARQRDIVAVALGLPREKLAVLTDDEIAVALQRLQALVDQCRHLASEATTDELTGALRRGAGLAGLQREIDRARRLSTKGLAVAFVDVDGLKDVNDAEGHAAGDRLLQAVVLAIRERLRSYDLVVRYGGDEFLCVLPETTLEEAQKTASDIARNVEARTQGRSASIGLAGLQPSDSAASLVGRADADLYARRRALRT